VWQIPEADLQVLGDVAGKDVLELGCGAAQWSISLAGLGARTVGLDLSPKQLEHARTAMAGAGVEFPLVEASAEDVPLEDESLDVAIFCLSLMGSNFTDYIREAHRCLRLDGMLHIWEPASYFDDLRKFCNQLGRLGFATIEPVIEGAFARIYAVKNTKKVDKALVLPFRGAA